MVDEAGKAQHEGVVCQANAFITKSEGFSVEL